MTLSIIIPVYNIEKYLKKCLDSVLKQELEIEYGNSPEYEVIAVDDGSTDSSLQILLEYQKEYANTGIFSVFSKENGGVGSARNAGIEKAKGKYLLFLDSDDYLAPNAISQMLKECQREFDICIFDFVSVTENGKFLKLFKGCGSETLNHFPIDSEGRTSFFSFNENPRILFEYPSSTNKILRRSLFIDNKIVFPGRCWFEDLRTTPKLYPHAKKIMYIDRGWYIYRQQPTSITHGSNTERNLEIIDAVEEVVNYYRKNNYTDSCSSELEYMVYYNELLTSTDRVNLIDPHSPVQKKLLDYIRREFPNYKSNPYYLQRPAKYKLLDFFIEHQLYGLLNLTLRMNNRVQGK